jgi:hypothetical protein
MTLGGEDVETSTDLWNRILNAAFSSHDRFPGDRDWLWHGSIRNWRAFKLSCMGARCRWENSNVAAFSRMDSMDEKDSAHHSLRVSRDSSTWAGCHGAETSRQPV